MRGIEGRDGEMERCEGVKGGGGQLKGGEQGDKRQNSF